VRRLQGARQPGLLGEAVHNDIASSDEQAAIIDPRTWGKAHAVMAEPAHRRAAATRAQISALLKGLIFGPNGWPMSPSHTRRPGRIYRYYVTCEGSRARADRPSRPR
jgi:site-specific DNA recombinase